MDKKNVQKIYINLGKYAKGIAIPIQNEAGKTTLLISDEDKIHCCLLNDSLQVESVHLIMDDPRLLFKKKHLGNCKRK
ncbi:hypothetical protein [Solitalea canadensis]|uniref:Uncharacterized protein n=1 Tax=Solitalea canadensis (strain ATCC 29591 / DSM 3403 / JCM 21819 / LMG 8368 / NBRC 15130 / NCIMB 12057 / USAM 9D) TaxID=929556 RepID=H8KY16_SOLCM|nr:hypothetical protein [Solitalea canadensis]AFD05754.1 hypothetical protein Solca_0629 [Solitalea canadensis DSM 3403]